MRFENGLDRRWTGNVQRNECGSRELLENGFIHA
jgi:hypothetical protein